MVGYLLVACAGENRARTPPQLPGLPRPGLYVLQPGETHRYPITLEKGFALAVEVQEGGVDLRVGVALANDADTTWVDGPFGRVDTERVLVIAEASPLEAELLVEPWKGSGQYRLGISRRRATAQDRQLVSARTRLAEADRARRERRAEAVELFRSAAQGLTALGDWPHVVRAWYRLGLTARDLGRSDTENAAYRAALTTAVEGGLALEEALVLRRLAWVEAGERRCETAQQLYRQAAQAFARAGEPRHQLLALNEIGRCWDLRGDLGRAEASYRFALAAAQAAAMRAMQGTILNNLGEIHLRLGQTDRALAVARQALELRRSVGDLRGEAISLTSIGTALRRLGRLAEARASFRESLRLHLLARSARPDSRSWDRIANPLAGIALLHLGSGDLGRAERALTSAIELATRAGERRSTAMAILVLAEVYERRGEPERAMSTALQALELLEELDDKQGLASACFALARNARILGRVEWSLVWIELAVTLVESIRSGLDVDFSRLSYFAWKRSYFTFWIDLLMSLHRRDPDSGWAERAFEISDRSRARGLVDLLALKVGASLAPDSAVDAQERHLRKKVADLERARLERRVSHHSLQSREGGPTAQDLLRELESLQINRAGDGGGDTVGDPSRLSVQRVRDLLDSETLVIEITLGPERSYLWLIGLDTFEAFTLPGRARIERMAIRAHRALRVSFEPIAAAQAYRSLVALSRLLLEPIADHLADKRLLVVTDGALHYVPFAVLPDLRRLADENLPPLAAGHEVIALPSVSTAKWLRSRPPSVARHVAVIADPVFEATDPRFSQVVSAGSGAELTADYGRLRHSAHEAQSILGLVSPELRIEATGFDANLDLVYSGRLADAKIVHFATHGRFDSGSPLLSGLVLARFDRDGTNRDAMLYAHQIFDLDLDAELVVLSACQTAVGPEVEGEGILGMTRGLLHAGARRVLVSLWHVDDLATAELMADFYRLLLQDGLPPGAALRGAQLAAWSRTGWSSPSSWAGFVLQGLWP